MNRLAILILVATIALSAIITVLSRGRVFVLFLPLLIGLPLAGLFRRR